MARIRSIKPSFFTNEELGQLPFEVRLLFAGLWTQADREGRLEDRPKRLSVELFPYDREVDVDAGLTKLASVGFIVRYEVNGVRLIAIPKWRKHQQPHVKEAASVLPAPEGFTAPESPEGFTAPGEHRAGTRRAPREGKGTDPDPDHDPELAQRARFERFWVEYPRKVAKDAAWKEWLKSSPDDATADVMIAALRRHKASPQWTKDDGQFIPHPRTWLHQKRWQDEPERETRPEPRPVVVDPVKLRYGNMRFGR